MEMISVRIIRGELEDLQAIRDLFNEYSHSLAFGLEFQNFAVEIATLPGEYTPPYGELLIAKAGRNVVGCVGLRKFSEEACEMKRLYVRTAFRGRKIGRDLVLSLIECARQKGYREMYLDTVPSMIEAQNLYESLGFVSIPPYRHNPVAGARFMRLNLKCPR